MNMPGLPLRKTRPTQIGSPAEIGEHGLQIAQDGLAEGVGPAAGLVEGHQGDVAVEDFQTNGGGRGCGHGDSFLGRQ